MKLKISYHEAELLLESENAKTIQAKPLSGFQTAFLDYLGDNKFDRDYLVSIDENPHYLFDSKDEALAYFKTLTNEKS